MADSVKGTPRRRCQTEASLERKFTKQRRKSWLYYGSNRSCPGKPTAKERRLTNKNVKRLYEKLNDVDELLQDVLNVHSLATNGYALFCKRFLPRPRASDSAIVYGYVTHACMCVDKRHDVAQGRRSLVFDKSWLNAPSPYMLLVQPWIIEHGNGLEMCMGVEPNWVEIHVLITAHKKMWWRPTGWLAA